MATKRPTGSQSRLILPYERTLVGSVFPESGLAVPFANTIVQSVTPLVWAQPSRAPELATWMASPSFPPNQNFTLTIHAWPIVMGSPEELSHFNTLGKRIAGRKTVSPYAKFIRHLRSSQQNDDPFAPLREEVQTLLWLILRHPEKGFAAKWTLKQALEKALGGYLAKLPEYVRQRLEDERRTDWRYDDPLVEEWSDNLRYSPTLQEEPPLRREAEIWNDIRPVNLQAELERRDEVRRFIEIVTKADPQKTRYFQCLAEGMSLDEAAKAVGVSAVTGWKWREDLKQRLAR